MEGEKDRRERERNKGRGCIIGRSEWIEDDVRRDRKDRRVDREADDTGQVYQPHPTTPTTLHLHNTTLKYLYLQGK